VLSLAVSGVTQLTNKRTKAPINGAFDAFQWFAIAIENVRIDSSQFHFLNDLRIVFFVDSSLDLGFQLILQFRVVQQ